MKKILLVAIIIAFALVGSSAKEIRKESKLAEFEIRVDSTRLADMKSAFDVLMQINGVSYVNNAIVIDNKNVAAVYIGTERLSGVTDLFHLPANHIQTIKITRSPNASYGKDVQAVVVISLLKEYFEGLRLNDHLQLDMTHKLATGNELSLGYKRNQLDVSTFLAFNETYSKPFEEDYTWTYGYDGSGKSTLKSLSVSDYSAESYTQLLTGGLSMNYEFNRNHAISVSYNCKWLRRNNSFYDGKVSTSYVADKDGHLDMLNPTGVVVTDGRTRHPKTHHTFDIEYTGVVGDWTLSAGSTSFKEFANKRGITYGDASVSHSDFLRKEANSRTFFNAKRKLWKGSIMFGPEYVYSGMDLLSEDYAEGAASDDRIHAFEKEHTIAAYVNTTQVFGQLSLDLGVRYEHVKYNYKTLADDMGEKPINVNRRHNNFYPNITATLNLGKSKLTLSHVQTFAKPYLGDTQITISGTFWVDNYIIKTEHITTNMIGWQWNILRLRGEHNYYKDPICSGYTGESYHAMDFYIDVAPKISIWQPVLSINVHKQWFNQMTADRSESLKTPLCFAQLNNTFTLPRGWLVRLNGKWRSSGADRDAKFNKGNFTIDASLQKGFFKNKLIAELSAANLIHSDWNYRLTFDRAKEKTVSGTRARMVRMVSLSLRYTL